MASTTLESGIVLFDPTDDLRFQVRQIHPSAADVELERVAFDESYRQVAEKKYHHLIIKAHSLSPAGANVLKQTCLTLGTDAGVHKHAINCKIDRGDVLITATASQLEKLVKKLRPQPFGLKPLSEAIQRMLLRQRYLQNQPIQVMAILNVTPDSFSDGGQFNSTTALLKHVETVLALGADYLDIGGESTRPGSQTVPVEEELQRVIPAIMEIKRRFPQARISIDTRKSPVARAALEAGAEIINDVSGLVYDPQMAAIAADYQCPVILMHSQGTPDVMQQSPHYDDVVGEVAEFFYRQVAGALAVGIQPQHIILDPGFGFGKTLEHNLELMRRLSELTSIGFPLLVGTSRKSFLTLGNSDIPVDEREALTAASITMAVESGARILRLHDIQTQMPVVNWLKKMKFQLSRD